MRKDPPKKHILFMCVANSARSQMAEGLARALAPTHVKISSAGSQPTQVRPEAVAVMAEIGIDISGHYSKSVAELDGASVNTVVTLCAQEVCPVFLGDVVRLHWGMTDPAAVVGDEEARLEAFRRVRDAIQEKLHELFA